MNKNVKELIESMSKLDKVTGEDVMFAFQMGYREGRIEVLEEQLGGTK